MRALLLLTIAVAASRGPIAAQVLTLTEFDLDRGHRAVDGRTAPAIVDINSLIRIRLGKDSLRRHAVEITDSSAELDSLVQQAGRLQRASTAGIAALPTLRQALEELARSPQEASLQRKFSGAAEPVALQLTQIRTDLAPRGSPLRRAIDAALDTLPQDARMLARVHVVFDVAAQEADRIRAGLDSLYRAQGVGLLLGAWVWTKTGSRPIHLPGVDEYPQGDYAQVQRWSLALTPEQQQQFQDLSAQADQARLQNIDVTARLQDGLREALRAVADSAIACVARLQSPLDQVRAAAGGELRDALTVGLAAFDRARASIVAIAGRYGPGGLARSADPATFLSTVTGDLQTLIGNIRELRAAGLELANRVRLAAANPALTRELESCGATLVAGTAALQDAIGPVAGILDAAHRIDTSTLEFGQQVLRLDIATAPEETPLDLKWTGARAEGDAVIIRLGLARRDQRPTQLEEHQLVLYRVLPHSRVAVNVVFADPLPASVALPSRFQPGASVSFVYTWGSRRSAGYNRFWRAGVGANFAALDLNRDGTQELGLGLALSALAERAQVGIGYDVAQDATYWFFGLQLPLLGKTLGSLGGGQGETNP